MSNILLESKLKTLEIDDNKLIKASGYAIVEAMRWSEVADTIFNKTNLRRQTCISALFSIELFMKAILMSDGFNVKKRKYNHNIYKLYLDINEQLKVKIKENIRVDRKVIAGIKNEELSFSCFEEQLEYIANDFMYLRYEYEKFLNGHTIITFTNFIMTLKDNIQAIAFDYVSKKLK